MLVVAGRVFSVHTCSRCGVDTIGDVLGVGVDMVRVGVAR